MVEGLTIRVVGVNGDVLHVHGEDAGAEGIFLGADQVKGLWEMPVDTEWDAARREFGGHLNGVEYPAADVTLGFHVTGGRIGESYLEPHLRLRAAFSYRLDRWDPNARLARIEVESERGVFFREVQLFEQMDFEPEIDPVAADYGLSIVSLRAANPAWRGDDEVTKFIVSGTSGAGEIEVENPSSLEMAHTWVLTRADAWVIPDFSWTGPPGARTPGGEFAGRKIPLRPITAAQGGVRVSYDPMKLMIADWAGQNALGQVGGGYFFIQENTIPSFTQRQTLPISVSGAPAAGARAELHQPRWFETPFGVW